VTADLIVNKLDEVKASNYYRSDKITKKESSNNNEILLREVCVVNDKEWFSNGTENIAKSLIDTLKLKDTKKEILDKSDNKDKDKILEIHI